MLVFILSMKIIYLLSLWLKYPINWTNNSISAWPRKRLPPFTVSYIRFGSGWLFSLGLHWPKPYAPYCSLISCQNEVVCVWEREKQTKTKKRETERQKVFPWMREFFNCFQGICMSFFHCLVLFSLNHYLVLCMTVSFLLLLCHNIGSSDMIYKKPEEFLEENILLCYIRVFSFCFLHKRSQLTWLWSSYKHWLFEEKYIMKTFYLKMMISQYLWSFCHGQCIELGVLRIRMKTWIRHKSMHMVFPLYCFQKDLQGEFHRIIDCLYKWILLYRHKTIQIVSKLGWIGSRKSIWKLVVWYSESVSLY